MSISEQSRSNQCWACFAPFCVYPGSILPQNGRLASWWAPDHASMTSHGDVITNDSTKKNPKIDLRWLRTGLPCCPHSPSKSCEFLSIHVVLVRHHHSVQIVPDELNKNHKRSPKWSFPSQYDGIWLRVTWNRKAYIVNKHSVVHKPKPFQQNKNWNTQGLKQTTNHAHLAILPRRVKV